MIMKKILLTLACVFGMSMTAFAVQNSAVMLQHKSNITTYEPEQINDAIANAEDGDVIYLTAGDFPGFTVDRQISIKGSGMLTVIKGTVKVENKNPDVILNNVFIGYMQINGTDGDISFYVNSRVRGFRLSQCRIVNGIRYMAITEDSYIDRCEIQTCQCGLSINETYEETVTIDGVTSKYTRSYLKGLTITNSWIGSGYGSNKYALGVNFINCYILSGSHEFHLYGVKIMNSILRHSSAFYIHKSQLINSSYGGITLDNDCKLTDCYNVKIDDYTSEDIYTNGYVGNDTKVIGPMGGNTPYTLEPTIPHVTNAYLSVDAKKQELNAAITVSPK